MSPKVKRVGGVGPKAGVREVYEQTSYFQMAINNYGKTTAEIFEYGFGWCEASDIKTSLAPNIRTGLFKRVVYHSWLRSPIPNPTPNGICQKSGNGNMRKETINEIVLACRTQPRTRQGMTGRWATLTALPRSGLASRAYARCSRPARRGRFAALSLPLRRAPPCPVNGTHAG
jgi:hypothetical protein